MRKSAPILLILPMMLLLLYLGLGLAFHFRWKQALTACQQARLAQGEFVETAVFDNILGLTFDVAFWPVYAWANRYHDGVFFATPCTH